MMGFEEKRYPYKAKWYIFVLVYALFGAGSFLFYNVAINNDRGLIINGIIKLSTEGSTIFYWILFAISIGIVVLMAITLYFSFKDKEMLQLKSDRITIPPYGLRRKSKEIKYTEIIAIDEIKITNDYILTIKSKNGKAAINSQLLPKKSDYEEIKSIIYQQIKL